MFKICENLTKYLAVYRSQTLKLPSDIPNILPISETEKSLLGQTCRHTKWYQTGTSKVRGKESKFPKARPKTCLLFLAF